LKKTHFPTELPNYASSDLIAISYEFASYHSPYAVKKSLKKKYGNMLKTAMSHIAPVPNSPGLPY
jgi:hypothetical protein